MQNLAAKEAQTWIEAVTGECFVERVAKAEAQGEDMIESDAQELDAATLFHLALKDGTLLCKYAPPVPAYNDRWVLMIMLITMGNFQRWCRLLNEIKDGAVRHFHRRPRGQPGSAVRKFAEMENILFFLKACRTVFELRETQLFTSEALQQGLGLRTVRWCHDKSASVVSIEQQPLLYSGGVTSS